MAKHVFYIPDCPECGAEMVKRASFDTGPSYWWRCESCGHESETTNREDFDALTLRLTAELRGED